jgi:hypothetical protein
MFTLDELRNARMASLRRLCRYLGLRVSGLDRGEMICWVQMHSGGEL